MPRVVPADPGLVEALQIHLNPVVIPNSGGHIMTVKPNMLHSNPLSQLWPVLFVFFFVSIPSQAVNFDCTRAATRTEKAICSDPGYTRDKNPPEVDALIGMRIPPIVPGKKSGHIPGWASIGGASFNDWVGVSQVYSKYGSAIAVIRRDKDQSRLILDVKMLPPNILTYDLVNNKTRLRKEWHRYYAIGGHCERQDGEYIIGLMRPEPGKHDCNHESRQVIKAWQVNIHDGQMKEIQPIGVRCFFDRAEDDCSG